MAKELLSPDFTVDSLIKRLAALNIALEQKRKELKDHPEGHLRIAQTSHKPQYYHYIEPKEFKGVFIPRSNDDLARQLAQKDYDLKVVKLLENEIHAMTRCLRQLCRGGRLPAANSSTATKLGELYAKMCPARQRLVTPVTLTAEQYTKQWLSVTWPQRPFSIVTLHPDFLCLNVKSRSEFYWEHFGLMDNPDYSNNAAGKLRLYTENGIIAGRNLIITMETQSEPLTTRLVERIIKDLLAC